MELEVWDSRATGVCRSSSGSETGNVPESSYEGVDSTWCIRWSNLLVNTKKNKKRILSISKLLVNIH